MKRNYLIAGGAVAIAGAAAIILSNRRTIPKGVQAITDFDKEKYLGKWFEIARMDYFFEHGLTNATAEYSLIDDSTIKVVNRGFNIKKNKDVEVTGKAKFVGDDTEAKLKVAFFGPFYAGYNIVAIDPKYKYALVAGKNFDYLWLLSRDKTMPDKIKKEFLEKAVSLGFDISKLTWTKQDKSVIERLVS